MNELETFELFIDEAREEDGIEAISLVEFPAIEENFVALSKHKEFKTVDTEKRVIVGLALVPDKPIYRRSGDKEYNIIFSKETVRKASELYLKRLKLNNATLEHDEQMTSGVSVIESWIVEDPSKDKTALYGLNAVKGAWAVTMKIDNDEVWEDVKSGKYLGLSIEGMFSDRAEDVEEVEANEVLEQIKDMLAKEMLESYSDYPQSATNNAKKALKYKKENGSSCGTSVGWAINKLKKIDE